MSGQGTQRLLQVCREAVARPVSERMAYLDRACAGEEELRRAVEALLAEESSAADFLETPAWTADRARLAAGSRLGPYEIQAFIGAGGMGEVYKARDTRLDRSVAIKILPPAAAADPERRARFEREAKTIAALNHPHICALHDVGDRDGSMFLVMEHIAGDTLAERLRKGPLPLEQALTIATQIADALAAAHRQGVIHRDLKPGNVILTKSGAKLLDFGLAKLKTSTGTVAAPLTASAPTRDAATSAGTLVGTVPYMAPEQLEGTEADARSDIFAFGTVLYQMLTGKRAFEGESHASVIAAILDRDPPPPSSVAPLTPPVLDRLVRQCLAKSPDERPDTAHDVANELRRVKETSGVTPLAGPRSRHQFRTAALEAGAACAVLGAILGVGAMWLLRPASPSAPAVRSSLEAAPADELNSGGDSTEFLPTPGGSHTALTWTPDGQTLVFVGRRNGVQQLFSRRLASGEAQPLSGTEGAVAPAVCPDGQRLVFWADRAIKSVPLGGGPAVTLAPGIVEAPSGLVCDAAGSVYFADVGGPIMKISPKGAITAATTQRETERGHELPSLLPGGQTLLYTVRKRIWSWGDEQVVAQSLRGGKPKVVVTNAADGRYVPTGHLVFMRQGVLFAVAFDAERLEARGAEHALVADVAQAVTSSNSNDLTGAGQFAIASNGSLAYLPGRVPSYQDAQLVKIDRSGNVMPLAAEAKSWSVGRLSPDGRYLALTKTTHSEVGVWLHDLVGQGVIPLTLDGECTGLVWSPVGDRLLFRWVKDGRTGIATLRADGRSPSPQFVVKRRLFPSSFTSDGRHLAAVDPQDVPHTVIITLDKETANIESWPETPLAGRSPTFSPDGRWLAYASDVTGRYEVYLRAYPGPGQPVAVSAEGGDSPAWTANGRELFYVSLPDANGKRAMMVTRVASGPVPGTGAPRRLFSFDPREYSIGGRPIRNYDVSADGQTIYAKRLLPVPPQPVVTHITLVQNWFEELKAKAPVK